MSKQWQVKPLFPPALSDQFPELNRLVLQLLHNRGITEPEQVENFLSPEYQNLHSPFLFQDMEKAAGRVWQAIENQEKIYVYSDYDADAVTANAVLQQTFRYLGVPSYSYIPDRFTEGYGLNVEAFRKLKADGAQLVITVDCGTNSIEVADYCLEAGIDLIITDHHEITGVVPQAYALINPKNSADLYPDSQITGVGVAYKLAKAILSHKDGAHEWDKWLLDLVAIGTVADCHSLLGENRILVKYGLKVLAKTKWTGLRVLMENADLELASVNLDTKILGFTIAPRINAAGRLEHADIALQLLLTADYAEAITLSNRLEEINRRRQDMTNRIASEARAQAELVLDRQIIMVSHSDWPRGLVGIVAGRLAEQYRKPVLVLEKGEVESTGSGRSAGEFDLVACLQSAAHLLVKYGGHKQAAGLTLRSDQLEVFYQHILQYAAATPDTQQEDVLDLEAELAPGDFTLEAFEEISRLEPFGADNTKPKFFVPRAELVNYKLVGASQQHVQLQFALGDKVIEGIAFSMGALFKQLVPGATMDLAGELIADTWGGMKRLKLRVSEVRLHA